MMKHSPRCTFNRIKRSYSNFSEYLVLDFIRRGRERETFSEKIITSQFFLFIFWPTGCDGHCTRSMNISRDPVIFINCLLHYSFPSAKACLLQNRVSQRIEIRCFPLIKITIEISENQSMHPVTQLTRREKLTISSSFKKLLIIFLQFRNLIVIDKAKQCGWPFKLLRQSN